MNENYLCNCGHSKDKHVNLSLSCYGCLDSYTKNTTGKGISLTNPCNMCTNFRIDNLALLEQKYDEKILEQYKKLEVLKEI